MKKLLIMLLCLSLAFCLLTACGSKEPVPAAAEPVAAEPVATQEPVAAQEPVTKEAPVEETEVLELPVTIENNTGVDIYELYASGQNQEEWGEDLLGSDSYLPDGNAVDMLFNIDADSLKWDIMIKDSEGTAIELYGLDFSECSTDGGTIDLEFDGTNGTATLYSE